MTALEQELTEALRELKDRFAHKVGTPAKMAKDWRDGAAWEKASAVLAKVEALAD